MPRNNAAFWANNDFSIAKAYLLSKVLCGITPATWDVNKMSELLAEIGMGGAVFTPSANNARLSWMMASIVGGGTAIFISGLQTPEQLRAYYQLSIGTPWPGSTNMRVNSYALSMYNTMKGVLKPAAVGGATGPVPRLLIVGHSIGGCVGSLLKKDIWTDGTYGPTSDKNLRSYFYGSPRVGNTLYTAEQGLLAYSIRNSDDPVTNYGVHTSNSYARTGLFSGAPSHQMRLDHFDVLGEPRQLDNTGAVYYYRPLRQVDLEAARSGTGASDNVVALAERYHPIGAYRDNLRKGCETSDVVFPDGTTGRQLVSTTGGAGGGVQVLAPANQPPTAAPAMPSLNAISPPPIPPVGVTIDRGFTAVESRPVTRVMGGSATGPRRNIGASRASVTRKLKRLVRDLASLRANDAAVQQGIRPGHVVITDDTTTPEDEVQAVALAERVLRSALMAHGARR